MNGRTFSQNPCKEKATFKLSLPVYVYTFFAFDLVTYT